MRKPQVASKAALHSTRVRAWLNCSCGTFHYVTCMYHPKRMEEQNAVLARNKDDPRTIAIFEFGSKFVKAVIVVQNDKFKWAFINPITNIAYHQYEGNYTSVAEALMAVEKFLTNKTRVL